jgi:hypothetical protein
MLFHHAPERTDAQIDQLLDYHREQQVRDGSRLAIHAASEGMEVELSRAGVVSITTAPPSPSSRSAHNLNTGEDPSWK